jgi:hypothetical protein
MENFEIVAYHEQKVRSIGQVRTEYKIVGIGDIDQRQFLALYDAETSYQHGHSTHVLLWRKTLNGGNPGPWEALAAATSYSTALEFLCVGPMVAVCSELRELRERIAKELESM